MHFYNDFGNRKFELVIKKLRKIENFLLIFKLLSPKKWLLHYKLFILAIIRVENNLCLKRFHFIRILTGEVCIFQAFPCFYFVSLPTKKKCFLTSSFCSFDVFPILDSAFMIPNTSSPNSPLNDYYVRWFLRLLNNRLMSSLSCLLSSRLWVRYFWR